AVGGEAGDALGHGAAHLVELAGDEHRLGRDLEVEDTVDAADRRGPVLEGARPLVEGGQVAPGLAGDFGEVAAGVDEGAAHVDGLEVAVAGIVPDERAGGRAPGLDPVAGPVVAAGGHEGQRPVAGQGHRREGYGDPGRPRGGQAAGDVDGGQLRPGDRADQAEVAGDVDERPVGRQPDPVDGGV